MFEKICNFISNNEKLEGHHQRFLSVIFLFISSIMCFLTYSVEYKWWIDTNLKISPSFIPSIIAICLVSPLYLRGILKWNKSIFTIISTILILIVFSSFIELATGGKGFKKDIISYGLFFSVILSWLGMRAISGACWILVIILAVYSIINNNIAMGFYGFIYITCAFLGLVLHSGLNPGELFKELKSEFSGIQKPIMDNAKENIKETIETINQYAKA